MDPDDVFPDLGHGSLEVCLWFDVWGVDVGSCIVRRGQRPSVDLRIREVDRELVRRGLAKRGDLIVVVAGHPAGTPGNTNLMTLHRVGENRS